MTAEQATANAGAVPRHVALIMDGNGRWARHRGWPRTAGHKAGAEALVRAVEAAVAYGVEHLTVFAFSTDNWKREQEEVKTLFALLRDYTHRERARLNNNGVRFAVLGDPSDFGSETAAAVSDIEQATIGNTSLQLNVALNYGGREDILHAARQLAKRVRTGEIDPEAISEYLVRANLNAPTLPDPDVIVRTSGEKRISNFLIWQAAHAELVFLNTLWPEFDERDFAEIVAAHQRRSESRHTAGAV